MAKYAKNSIYLVIPFMMLAFGFSVDAQTAPSVTTGDVAFIGARNVYLNAAINPNGKYTQVWFQLDTVNPPASARGYQGAGNGTSLVNIQAGVINLRIDSTYYYRAVAQSSAGITLGEVKSFSLANNSGSSTVSNGNTNNNSNNNSNTTTNGNTSTNTNGNSFASLAPSVITNGPVSVTGSSASVNGSINANNASATFWFEFGLTQSLGQKTSVQPAGSANSWQLVTGNISGLEPGKTYFYRVVAQNSIGTSFGETRSFTTSGTTVAGTNTVSSGTATSTSTGTNQNNTNPVSSTGRNRRVAVSPVASNSRVRTAAVNAQANPRPSYISLEYSLNDSGALVVVSEKRKPKQGEIFDYTVVYKNDTANIFNESRLKIIIPVEAEFVSSDIEPIKISSNIVEFSLGNVDPASQGTVTVSAKVKENTKSGANMTFTSVLGYKDKSGVQLATTAYLSVVSGGGGEGSFGSASLFKSFFGSSTTLILITFALVLLFGLLTFRLVKIRNSKKMEAKSAEADFFGLEGMPPTFEPVQRKVDIPISVR